MTRSDVVIGGGERLQRSLDASVRNFKSCVKYAVINYTTVRLWDVFYDKITRFLAHLPLPLAFGMLLILSTFLFTVRVISVFALGKALYQALNWTMLKVRIFHRMFKSRRRLTDSESPSSSGGERSPSHLEKNRKAAEDISPLPLVPPPLPPKLIQRARPKPVTSLSSPEPLPPKLPPFSKVKIEYSEAFLKDQKSISDVVSSEIESILKDLKNPALWYWQKNRPMINPPRSRAHYARDPETHQWWLRFSINQTTHGRRSNLRLQVMPRCQEDALMVEVKNIIKAH